MDLERKDSHYVFLPFLYIEGFEQGEFRFKFNLDYCKLQILTFDGFTVVERFTSETRGAATDCIMIDYFTNGIFTTNSYTGICTFLINACLILWTFTRNDTFSSAIWWHAYVIWLAWTNRMLIYFVTNTIWTTWWWLAGIDLRWNGCYNIFRKNLISIKKKFPLHKWKELHIESINRAEPVVL